MINILLDTNIIIDFASKRIDFYEESKNVLSLAMHNKCKAYLTATTVTDIFYILKKENGETHTIDYLKEILLFIDIIGVDKNIVIDALYSGWKDFEDAVQAQTAIANGVNVIVTRNVKDFCQLTAMKVLTPAEFIQMCV